MAATCCICHCSGKGNRPQAARACDGFRQQDRPQDQRYVSALLQALLNAVPRARVKGKFARPEAEALENMRLAFFDDLGAPAEDEPGAPGYVQMGLAEAQEDPGDDAEES